MLESMLWLSIINIEKYDEKEVLKMKNEKLEKGTYKILDWIFVLFTVITSLLILVIITLYILCYFPSVYKIIIHTFQDAPFEIDYLAEIRRPLYTLTLCINLVLYAITFFYVHKFFNNLVKERIFVIENVTFSKRIALILLLLAVISGAPTIISNFYKVPRIYSFYIDENYLFGAVIIGALAKILEKANIIVEEHDLTI